MNYEDVKNKILNSKRILYKEWRNICFDVIELELLKQNISWFDDIKTYAELKNCIKNNYKERPLCVVCGKPAEYNKSMCRYTIFCSKPCRKSIFGKKYIANLSKQTNLERYGVENISQIYEVKDKKIKTCIKNYGVEHPLQNNNILQKIKQTNLERYGKERYTQTEEGKDKYKKTCVEKYGVENLFQSEEIKNKIKQKLKTNYNVEHPMFSEEIKNKLQQTNLSLYGSGNVFQSEMFLKQNKIKTRYNYWETFNKLLELKNIKPLFTKEEYISYDYDITPKKYHCDKCGKNFESEFLNVQKIYCSDCIYKSSYEIIIKNWILNEFNIINIRPNKRFGKQEIDLFLPDYNIGIEFHGLYWHSDINKSKDYHQEKYLFFKEKGIELIQIFESEWLQKEHVVKSIIKNKLKLNKNITLSDYVIEEISNSNVSDFINTNNIITTITSDINIGLFCEQELVYVLSFIMNNDKEYEIVIDCSKVGYNIDNGFGLLLDYFIKKYDPNIVIRKIDVRYDNGESYIKYDFIEKCLNVPNYFYFKSSKLILYTVENIPNDVLEKFDVDKTEYENMLDNKYLRIFDAGNLVLEWAKK